MSHQSSVTARLPFTGHSSLHQSATSSTVTVAAVATSSTITESEAFAFATVAAAVATSSAVIVVAVATSVPLGLALEDPVKHRELKVAHQRDPTTVACIALDGLMELHSGKNRNRNMCVR